MSTKHPVPGPRPQAPPGSIFSPARLAYASASRPVLTLLIWAVFVIVGVVGASQLDLSSSKEIHGSDSVKANSILEDKVRGEKPISETIVVTSEGGATVDDPAFQAKVASIMGALQGMPETVSSSVSYLQAPEAGLVSEDRTKTIIPVTLTGDVKEARTTVEPMLESLEVLDGDGFTIRAAGVGSTNHDIVDQFEKDLSQGEMIGIPAAIVVLVIVFGAAVAAGVPVILGFVGIIIAVGLTGFLSKVLGIESVVINMISMIGLAVGIDYSLFIMERMRDERAAGLSKIDAIVKAGNTASRAVLFSGLTVIVALAGLLIVPATIFQAISIGASLVVLAAVAAALTLLPAVLSLLGPAVEWLPVRRKQAGAAHEDDKGFFAATTRLVMKHPVASVVLSSTLLIAAALPYLAINIGTPGLSQYPDHLNAVQAFETLDRDFSAGRLDPTELAIEGDVNSPEVAAAVARLSESVKADPRFSDISGLTANEAGDAGLVTILVNGDASAPEALEATRDLRDDYIPAAFDGTGAKVYVGGTSAETVDYIDTMNAYLPIVIGFVLTLSFLLLMMVFRSLVIPLKAIVMNLLSVGAAYGLLVLVFQEGVGADLLGFQQSDSIAAFLPVFLFAILFGLSMDYHVFLLSRIQERFGETGDNAASVAYGLRSTAHIITGAAAIMMVVFSGFAMGEMVEMQQMGFGLAVAVFLDATIVRSVLVPASMQLLGARNWYFPRWLNWLPKIQVEGESAAPPPAVETARELELAA